MKKVCILAVCHNSYTESIKFLKSISSSLKITNINLDLFFIDNSNNINVSSIEEIKSFNKNFNLQYISVENIGYFPSISLAIKKNLINLYDYDYSILSNVDLIIDKTFFRVIEDIKYNNQVGIYAPSIFSYSVNADRNPKISRKPSAFKLNLLRQCFRSPITFLIMRFVNISRLKLRQLFKKGEKNQKKTAPGVKPEVKKIYAAHGSCIILTKEYTKLDKSINYPIFLFGEEIYLAEKSKAFNLDTLYMKDLKVYDTEHASTSLMNSASYRKYNFDALSYVLKKYKF